MEYRFNPPPNWPDPPPDWVPLPGWQPDPSWPAPPPGWTWWMPADRDSAASTDRLNTGEKRGAATAVDVPPRTASGADMLTRLGRFLSRSRSWFLTRPTWAKVLLVLLLIGLLPWLLIAAGLTILGIGAVGFRRGSLPALRLPSRAAAAGTVLVGLVTLGAGSGLAASVLNSESSPTRTDPPIAAPSSSPSTPRTTTPTPAPPPPTTTRPPRPRQTVTTPTRPTRTPPPAPTPRPRTPRPALPLTVTIVSLPPTGQGNVATAAAHTAPGAACSIEVDYKSGPSTARGLDPRPHQPPAPSHGTGSSAPAPPPEPGP